MKEIKVDVHIITFINKDDPEDTYSVVGDSDIQEQISEDLIFGTQCYGLRYSSAMNKMAGIGHDVIYTPFSKTIKY